VSSVLSPASPNSDPLSADAKVCHAVVLCAGLGTRLAPLTHHVPKPLIPVANQPMLDRVLDRLAAAGVVEVGVNLHHQAEQLAAHVAARCDPPQVRTVYEPEILDTGGGIAGFRGWLEAEGAEHLLVHNADIVTDLDLEALIDAHTTSGAEATLALVDHEPTNVVALDPQGVVVSIRDQAPQGARMCTFAGVAVYSASFLRRLAPGVRSSVIDAMRSAMQECPGSVRGHVAPPTVYWRDMGHLQQYLEVHRELLAGQGAALPESSAWSGACLVDSTATVDPAASLAGFVVVGAGAYIGAGVSLHDCVVGPEVRLEAGFAAQRAVIFKDCVAYA
jgi:mannose-1-phosphate guanylyltransferase